MQHKMRKRAWLILLAGLGWFLAPAPGLATEALKAGFVYVGPVGNAGWTFRHDQGRQCLERQGIETTFVESVPETSEVANVERALLARGFDVIFATAYGYQRFTQEVARENPSKYFFGITPTVAPAENILNYYGKLWDARYLTGLVAGSMSRSNTVGFVAAEPIPTVLAGINAFTLGVREVNPSAEVRVVWTLSWYDPAGEKRAAESLVEAGADVVAQHQDTPSSVQGASEKGAWVIGSESDMTRFAPEKFLTGTIWDWCPFYRKAIAMVRDGSFAPGEFYGGLDDGTLSIAPLHSAIPSGVHALVKRRKAALVRGTFDYWTGPITTTPDVRS